MQLLALNTSMRIKPLQWWVGCLRPIFALTIGRWRRLSNGYHRLRDYYHFTLFYIREWFVKAGLRADFQVQQSCVNYLGSCRMYTSVAARAYELK